MRRLLAFLVLSFVLAADGFAASGQVGFRRMTVTDTTRPGVESEWRTIEVFVWYPAAEGGAPMTRADYFTSDAEGAPSPREELRRRAGAMLDEMPSDESLDAVLGESLDVRAGAAPAEGRFPIVLVTAGLGSPAYTMSSTCEAIAAAGYVVVEVPTPPLSAGSRLRFGQIALETMMRDLEATLGTLSSEPHTDPTHVALVGWSIGSVAHVLLQMRNPLVDALVSLDGGVGYDYGAALARESIWFRTEALNAPILDVRALATEGVPRAFDVLDLPRLSESWRLESDNLTHADLTTTFGELAPRLTSTPPENVATRRSVVRATTLFLDHVLKADGAAGLELEKLASPTTPGLRVVKITASPSDH